jgi:serine/threonine-protein kinase
MRTISIVGLAVACTVAAADARRLEPRSTDPQRQGIAAALPPDWIVQPPDPKWHGKRLTSPNGSASLAVSEDLAGKDIGAYMRSFAERDGERVTYLRRGQSWIVVSGFRGDRIFYRKAMLACANRSWHHITFDYPAAEKRAYDRFVTLASHALAAHRNEGCPTAAAAN